jgi:bifunctional non-homologous end joining protein LigD
VIGSAKTDLAPGRLATRPAQPPSFIAPQLAKLVEHAPAGDERIHEIKIDGRRTGARLAAAGRVTMLTRKALDWTARFWPVGDALANLPVGNAYLGAEGAAVWRAIVEAIDELQRDEVVN